MRHVSGAPGSPFNPSQGSAQTTSDKVTILVICQHNSGRSQIAEAYLNKSYGDHMLADSAGLEPAAAVNPLVVKVLAEEGIEPEKLEAVRKIRDMIKGWLLKPPENTFNIKPLIQ